MLIYVYSSKSELKEYLSYIKNRLCIILLKIILRIKNLISLPSWTLDCIRMQCMVNLSVLCVSAASQVIPLRRTKSKSFQSKHIFNVRTLKTNTDCIRFHPILHVKWNSSRKREKMVSKRFEHTILINASCFRPRC